MPNCYKLGERNPTSNENKPSSNFSKLSVEDYFVPVFGKANHS